MFYLLKPRFSCRVFKNKDTEKVNACRVLGSYQNNPFLKRIMDTDSLLLFLFKVEGFINLIEKESPTGKQKLTGHIISFVLVQSCCNCSQMGDCHLFLALRIFQFLNKKMDRFKGNCPSEEVRTFNFKLQLQSETPFLPIQLLDLCMYTAFSSVDRTDIA